MLKSQESRAAGRVEASAKALSCSCGKIKNQEQGLSALYFGRYESRPDPVPGAVLIAQPARVWLAAKTRGRPALERVRSRRRGMCGSGRVILSPSAVLVMV